MMSHRGKRQALSKLDDIAIVTTKRRKGRPSATTEEEETSSLENRLPSSSANCISSDMKLSSIYNRVVTEAPAELFRKDLISAMKLPDSEPLTSDHYWIITDQWKQEWEKGVQVPVKPDSLPGPVVNIASTYGNNPKKMHHEFKLPKNKYIRITKDEHFRVDEHYLSNVGIQAEKCCAYDLEDVDIVWLNILNGERALMGLKPLNQDQLERVIEELEMKCWEKVNAIVKKEEGLALEFDESVICDVCRSPDSEDGNEMVFCDCCNICVHQACYGITSIPSGSWLCRTCSLSLRPECVLCPNKNGAMKSTRSGHKWAHVSCALWIPEVSIGCVEKMEPITKISSIPQSRWALICVLCRERVGACIQCSVKTCKTAYHVTCAFKHGLAMRAIIDDENNADDDNTVKLRSYCQKHSANSKNENSNIACSDEEVKKKQRKDLTSEEKTHARAVKVQEIESEFEKHVNVKDITRRYDVDNEGLQCIYNYWVLKRRSSFNKPLIAARTDDASDLLHKDHEHADQEKMRMFVQLRQDLERVRNLCYMVNRREKLSRLFQKLREQTFYKQAAILSDAKLSLSTAEITAIKECNHGPSIYDRLYSHPNAEDLSTDFETMVHRIAGLSDPELSPRHGVNGCIFLSSKKEGKRFNGDAYDSLTSSLSEHDIKNHLLLTESDAHGKLNNRMNKAQRKNNVENRNKNTARRKKMAASAAHLDSTTTTDEEDHTAEDSKSKKILYRTKIRSAAKKQQQSVGGRPLSDSLNQQRFLDSRSGSLSSGDDDSDVDIFMFRKKQQQKKPERKKIYTSDSGSSERDRSPQSLRKQQIRTKASVKEFTPPTSGRHTGSSSKGDSVERGDNFAKTITFPSSKSIELQQKKYNRFGSHDEISDDEDDDECSKIAFGTKSAIRKIEFVEKSNSSKNEPKKTKDNKKGEVKTDKKKCATIEKKVEEKEVKDETVSGGVDQSGVGGPNYLDTLSLVPQRAAAKKAIKAIEHIKNGMIKPATISVDETIVVDSSNKSLTKSTKKDQKKSETDVKSSISEKLEKRSLQPQAKPVLLPNSSSNLHSGQKSSTGSTNSSVAEAKTALPSVKAAPASTSSSASSSSSGSSSSGSSSSSSSSSSSDSSSSGSSSSSSSSESESEDSPNAKKKKVVEKSSVPESTISTVALKLVPECKKHEVEADAVTVIARETESEPEKVEELKPEPEVLQQNKYILNSPSIDKNTMEAKAAVEHITLGQEQENNFMMDCEFWDTHAQNNGGMKNNLSPRNHSLFSPIKDLDLSSFDDEINENNMSDEPFSFSNIPLCNLNLAYKEDTKEDGARKTLDLVEKLKLEMARKSKPHDISESVGISPAPTSNSNFHEDTTNINEPVERRKDDGSTSSESNSLQTNSSSMIENVEAPPPKPIDMFNPESFTNEAPEVTTEPSSEQPPCQSVWSQQDYNADVILPTSERWNESVLIPSRRSDCSSALSSNSSVSSVYNSDLAPKLETVSSAELQHHLQQEMVSEEIRPSNIQPDFTSPSLQSVPENIAALAAFNFAVTVQDKLLYPNETVQEKPMYAHISPQLNQPSSLFSTSMFETMSIYTNNDDKQLLAQQYCQPLSIQPPCTATASFTTNSQNMAMITSIISPLPTSNENIAQSLSCSSLKNFEEKLAELIDETQTQQNFNTALSSIRLSPAVKSNDPSSSTDSNLIPPPPLMQSVQPESIKADCRMDIKTDFSPLHNTAEVIQDTPSTSIAGTPISTTVPIPECTTASIEEIPTAASDGSSVAVPAALPAPSKTSQTPSGKRSPRPVRASTRVMMQNKSPAAKSPISAAVSPARLESAGKGKSGSKKNKIKSSSGNRTRGRGRGRPKVQNHFYRDWDTDAIADKLAGTVYDFDIEDEAPNDNYENLRAMRERRKSTDTAFCDRLSTSSKDTCYSPKFASPSSQAPTSKRKNSVASTPDRRGSHRSQPSPLCEISNSSRVLQKDKYTDEDERIENDEEEEEEEEEGFAADSEKRPSGGSTGKVPSSISPALPQLSVQSAIPSEKVAIVHPMPPAPAVINENSYQNSSLQDSASEISKHGEMFLSDADTNITADELRSVNPIPHMLDVLEKEVQKYAAASLPSLGKSPTMADPDKNLLPEVTSGHFIAEPVELSGCIDGERNQLKMKIKGPYSDANYAFSMHTTLPQQQVPSSAANAAGLAPEGHLSASAAAAVTNTSASSSNLRRMRKKELLEQYKAQGVQDECVQELPMPSNVAVLDGVHLVPGHNDSSASESVKCNISYKLPKAVASMVTIPTKEDYKAVLESAGKKRSSKEKSMALDASDISNNNTSNMGAGSGATSAAYRNHYHKHSSNTISSPDRQSDNHVPKRKSRSATAPTAIPRSTPAAPPLKLKIKTGSGAGVSSVVLDSTCSVPSEDRNLRLRPPKKRLRDQSQFNENGLYDEFSDNDRGAVRNDDDDDQSREMSSRKRKKKSSFSSKSKKRRRQAKDEDGRDNCNGPIVTMVKNVESSDGMKKKVIFKFGVKPLSSPPPPPPCPAPAKKSKKSADKNASSDLPPSPIPPPKSSERNANNELDSIRTDKITPIRLKLKRSKNGYVTKSDDVAAPPATASETDMLPKTAAATTSKREEVSQDSIPNAEDACGPASLASNDLQVSALS